MATRPEAVPNTSETQAQAPAKAKRKRSPRNVAGHWGKRKPAVNVRACSARDDTTRMPRRRQQ